VNISDVCEQLKADEGFRRHVYLDHLGYETIGYGFLVDERRGGGLPRDIADYWLEQEVIKRAEHLNVRWPEMGRQPQEVQQALVNMAFQMGVGGVLGFKRMLEALRAGDRGRAADEAIDSKWARQTPNRAERVAAMIRGET